MDSQGIAGLDLGVYGVPETFVIDIKWSGTPRYRRGQSILVFCGTVHFTVAHSTQ
jgi:hypothetical protein